VAGRLTFLGTSPDADVSGAFHFLQRALNCEGELNGQFYLESSRLLEKEQDRLTNDLRIVGAALAAFWACIGIEN